MKRSVLLIVMSLLAWGCGSMRPVERYDDALDIRHDRQFHYETSPCICDETGTNRRDGRTLRGTVVEMLIRARRDTSGRSVQDTLFVFLSRCAAERRSVSS